jgi:hypothetical protein
MKSKEINVNQKYKLAESSTTGHFMKEEKSKKEHKKKKMTKVKVKMVKEEKKEMMKGCK